MSYHEACLGPSSQIYILQIMIRICLRGVFACVLAFTASTMSGLEPQLASELAAMAGMWVIADEWLFD